MARRPGAAKPALLLLCCLGTWLRAQPVAPHPLPPAALNQILGELQRCSAKLLGDYTKEAEICRNNTQKNHPLPCFTPGSEAANHTSIILAHFKQIGKIKDSALNKVDLNYTIQQLEKLNYPDIPEPQVPNCSEPFKCKCYILEVLQQFSDCMENIPGPSRNRRKSRSRLPCVSENSSNRSPRESSWAGTGGNEI